MFKIVRWKNKYVVGDIPIMKEYILFNFITISRHFKGFQGGGFRIEFLTIKSWFSFSFKNGFQKWLNCFKESPRDNNRLIIRFSVPIISFGVVSPKQFRNVEVV